MMRYLTGRATRIAPQMVYHDPIMSIALRFLVARSLLWLLGAPIWIGGLMCFAAMAGRPRSRMPC
jgi:hypothetical protein